MTWLVIMNALNQPPMVSGVPGIYLMRFHSFVGIVGCTYFITVLLTAPFTPSSSHALLSLTSATQPPGPSASRKNPQTRSCGTCTPLR